jgi:N-acetylmuramoyl-L-alanine amidase CwlA
MNIQWIGSPNYWAGRTQKVSKVVIHWMNGYLAGSDKTFNSNVGTDAATSAHYGIEDDAIHQYVRTEDTAWHARQANPFSIGIEHSAAPGRAATDKTYRNSIELIASLVKQYGLNPDSDIVYHKQYVATSCNELDINRIKTGVKDLVHAVIDSPVVVDKPSLPQPEANKGTGGTLHLPQSATSWRVYKESGPYTAGNEVGRLNPSLVSG